MKRTTSTWTRCIGGALGAALVYTSAGACNESAAPVPDGFAGTTAGQSGNAGSATGGVGGDGAKGGAAGTGGVGGSGGKGGSGGTGGNGATGGDATGGSSGDAGGSGATGGNGASGGVGGAGGTSGSGATGGDSGSGATGGDSGSGGSAGGVMEDMPLVRHPNNPLLTKGASGSIDQLKVGPRALLREGPKDWKIWYEAVPAGNKSFMALATSSDGLTWTKYASNPVMSPSEPWEGGADNAEGEVSPVSVLKEDGLYKVWYHGFNAGKRQIGYATSADGLNWTKHPANPVLTPGAGGAWDADSVCEPQVLRVGALYYMYYSHCSGSHGIGLATSSDGTSWTKYAGNPVIKVASGWEDKQVAWGEVYYDGNGFHIWYPGVSNTASQTMGHSLGYAYSADGKTWTKSSNNPVMWPLDPDLNNPDFELNKGDAEGLENRPNVLRLGAKWWVFYGGFAYCCPENATLCLATADVQGAPNKAPSVDAGADSSISAGGTAQLNGTVMDDDVPVTLDKVTAKWTKSCGVGTVTFANANTIDTSATFSAEGTYVLRLTGNDGKKSSSSDVKITVGQASSDCG